MECAAPTMKSMVVRNRTVELGVTLLWGLRFVFLLKASVLLALTVLMPANGFTAICFQSSGGPLRLNRISFSIVSFLNSQRSEDFTTCINALLKHYKGTPITILCDITEQQ